MSNITDRARARAHHHFLNTTTHDLFIECADRIEALEAALEEMLQKADRTLVSYGEPPVTIDKVKGYINKKTKAVRK